MNSQTVSRPQAALELALWQADADSVSAGDLYLWLRESGLPSEIAIRLGNLINHTKRVAGKVISLGKIILIKLIEFVRAHPNMMVGIALGAMIASLITSIPFLGPMLAPIVVPLGITIGAIAGHRVDVAASAKRSESMSVTGITQEVIEIARSFFQLFIDTILALTNEFQKEAA